MYDFSFRIAIPPLYIVIDYRLTRMLQFLNSRCKDKCYREFFVKARRIIGSCGRYLAFMVTKSRYVLWRFTCGTGPGIYIIFPGNGISKINNCNGEKSRTEYRILFLQVEHYYCFSWNCSN